MPSEPVLYQAFDALQTQLKTESEAGRITPPIADLSESSDFARLTAYPCVICAVSTEAAYNKDRNLMTAIVAIRAVIIEERPESVQRELIHFVHELRRAINRKDSYEGAIFIYRKATYKRLTLARSATDLEVLHYADLEFEVNYRERATER